MGFIPTFNEPIDADLLLKTVDQHYCWQVLLGHSAALGEYFKSPFRNDKNGRCFLDYAPDGNILCKDFSRREFIHLTAAVQKKLNLDYVGALKWIKATDGCTGSLSRNQKSFQKRKQFTFYLDFEPHTDSEGNSCFVAADAEYWAPRFISMEELKEDNVFSVSYFICNSKKNPDVLTRHKVFGRCYAYVVNSKCKLQFVDQPDKEKRFLSVLSETDIGGLEHLPLSDHTLFITKSYKEHRHFRNIGYNAIWVQGESMTINSELITQLGKRFDQIIIFYDNDIPGQEGAVNLSNKINSFFPKKSSYAWLKDYNDPDDLIMDKKSLKAFDEEIKIMLPYAKKRAAQSIGNT